MAPRRIPNEPINVPIPSLNAFIFDEKYLIDDVYVVDMIQKIDGAYVVHLDGIQLDRIHVTSALKIAFPIIEYTFGDQTKILVLDFAFHVLHGHAVRDGFVVVPINQQSTDLRAANLVLLPGNDRRLYRGTDIVPRDGLRIGGFLPRSVTIITSTEPGQYKFKISAGGGEPRKVVGFETTQAAQVFREKVVPLLLANDADFAANDVVYQALCASYCAAFPHEATTEAPPPPAPAPPKEIREKAFQPRCKAQLELKKTKRDAVMSKVAALEEAGLRECSTCETKLPFDRFEGTRLECMRCRQDRRSKRARSTTSKRDPASVPKPSACVSCGKGPGDVAFTWRSDILCGSWRNECTSCYNTRDYSMASRTRMREADEEGYLRRNATTHLAWALKNPEKVKEQQRLCATVPARKMKTIVTSAEQRDIDVSVDDVDEMQTKLSMACEYCGFTPTDEESLNGLDRVDSALGYTNANTVSCCATCNAMKGPLDVDVFVTNVRSIERTDAFVGRIDAADAPRFKMKPFSGRAELRDAPQKDKTDLLTRDAKRELWSSSCYLCGQTPSFGIDRVDASGDYTGDNSKPCCTDCNYMKKDLHLRDFRAHIGYVAAHTRMWTLGDVADKPFKIFGGKTRTPLAVLDDDGMRLIFPSGCTAGAMIGVSHNKVMKAIQNGTKCKGHTWAVATSREFREQTKIDGITRRAHNFLARI